MWSAIENSVSTTDPTAVLHSHLASALSTLGDAQYWEESISPAAVRQSLQEADPSNTSSTPTLLKGMKWLLASISKGRDVSDFYVVVVKLVACPVTEVRKMVYTYLIQYADHNAETRELSLLSINSFQRGLSDPEPLIRALALRVLTTVQLPDILAIQILAVTKHAKADGSPYVRKCAAVAIAKLAPRCVGDQRAILLELVQHVLNDDRTTMVLASALVAFAELTGADVSQLHMLHGCFRKLCHLLTDMDEWGQVVCLEVLTRYCRHFFREPANYSRGSAEQIDASRRVVRRLMADGRVTTEDSSKAAVSKKAAAGSGDSPLTGSALSETPAERAAAAGIALPHRQNRNIIKRRVVKKGFYSDEEDKSTEEEIFADSLVRTNGPLSSALRQRNVMAGGDSMEGTNNNMGGNSAVNPFDEEEADLDDDHRFLLRSAMSLLKSRNAGVVLAVCSLQYYCGVSSIPVRKAVGKALVRIHRAKHSEIQYVVLTSIRKLVQECPSAFAPFLHDFFVLPDMDPPFTRLIKLDILTSLALDPPSIAAVLKELRTYVQLYHNSEEYTDDDTAFVCAAVRAVGRVTEMARIVFDRHGRGSSKQRAEADTIALNCLYGLVTFSQTADHEVIVGETVTVMQRILQMLQSDGNVVHDPNQVRDRALGRILLLLVNTLSCLVDDEEDESEGDLDDDIDEAAKLEQVTLVLPPSATASALWLVGEYLAPLSLNGSALSGNSGSQGRSKMRLEVARVLVRCFLELDVPEKVQAIHFASKLLLSSDAMQELEQEAPLCEQLLAMGRVDSYPDVRDRARFESGVIHLTVGLKHDRDALDEAPVSLQTTKKLTLEDAKRIFLSTKPAPSYLPLEDENSSRGEISDHSDRDGDGCFRFGTLSSLVGHRARSAYLPLPPWADQNSPSSLREPPEPTKEEQPASNGRGYEYGNQGDFYHSSSSNDHDDSSSSSSSSGSKSGSDSSEASSSETDDDDNTSDGEVEGVLLPDTHPAAQHLAPAKRNGLSVLQQRAIQVESATDASSSHDSDDSSSGSETSAEEMFPNSSGVGTLIPMGGNESRSANPATKRAVNNGSSVADDMKGLVLAPVVVNAGEPTDSNFDRDSGAWIQLIRPEHSGGLLAEGRYLRGVTKAQQAQMMGLTSEKPTVVCLQIRFENQKQASGGSFRRIRILQRSSTFSGSAIGARKIVLPQEISELPAGRRADCVVGIDFASASDREGSLLAKLEIKFGSGGTPIEVKPSIGDLLLPCLRSVDEFDAAVSRMKGFHRAESIFSVAESSRSELPATLLSRAAFTVVGAAKPEWDDDNNIRLVGTLPASSDPVYVLTTCTVSGQGKLIVCCEHTLVANSIMNLLKRAISE
jgi:AP-3 complex subunit beta